MMIFISNCVELIQTIPQNLVLEDMFEAEAISAHKVLEYKDRQIPFPIQIVHDKS